MTPTQLSALLLDLLTQAREADQKELEWLEFKHNNSNPEEIGQYISALANSATLHGQRTAYLIWGIEDATFRILGTDFNPRTTKKGGQELESWLTHGLMPQVGFKMHQWRHEGTPLVLCEIPCAVQDPVAFKGERFIRVGSQKESLRSNRAKERALEAALARTPFEHGIAKSDLAADETLALLDFSAFFDLLKVPLPTDQQGILARLDEEKLVARKSGGRWDITNLGAILFAKNLDQFDRLSRKKLRVIKYKGAGRTESEREWRDPPAYKGYAAAFVAAVGFINSLLPENEPLGEALRKKVRMYPTNAVRELVANALVHQDFSVTGAGPMVEIFAERMEITNPGEPLVETLRFIDATPRSRNEALAALMRRMNICEERGSGIDKVIEAVELYQLPAPDFTTPTGSTKATLFAHQKLKDMDAQARIRACYQHACLRLVFGQKMTNASLRTRFGIEERNAAKASRLIKEAVEAGLLKPADPEQAKKYAQYLPFWA